MIRPMRTPPTALLVVLLAGACAADQDAAAPPAQDPAPAAEAAAATEEVPPEEVVEAEAETEAAPSLPPVRDERADAIVRAMAESLTKSGGFSVRIESWSDEQSAGGTLTSLPAEGRLVVRRPHGLYAERASERGLRRFWYDGKQFAALDVDKGLFVRFAAPPTIEATVDMLAERHGIVMPLADLLADDPHDSYSRVADRVEYLGTQKVRGVECHHIGFAAPWLRWQLWIAAEGDPLPRRVQITYADEPGEPRFLAHLEDWKLGAAAEKADFTFVAPEAARFPEIVAWTAAAVDALSPEWAS